MEVRRDRPHLCGGSGRDSDMTRYRSSYSGIEFGGREGKEVTEGKDESSESMTKNP